MYRKDREDHDRAPVGTTMAPVRAWTVDVEGSIGDRVILSASMTAVGGRFLVASVHGAARLELVPDVDLFLAEGDALRESAIRAKAAKTWRPAREQVDERCDAAIAFLGGR